MATKATTTTAAGSDEYEQMFSDWVYYIPGTLLIAAGFGGLALFALA